jgi:hypothetical protein
MHEDFQSPFLHLSSRNGARHPGSALGRSEESKLFLFFHWLYSSLGPWSLLFTFMIIFTDGRTLGRVISSSARRKAST